MIFFTLFMYAMASVIMGLAAYPSVLMCVWVWHHSGGNLLMLSLALGASYFVYGASVLVVTAILRVVLGLTMKPGRYPYVSVAVIKWMMAGGLALVARVTFGDFKFIAMTPFMNLYLRLMGARVSTSAVINSTQLYDVSLLTIEDNAVIGGDAVLTGHLAERGHLVFKPIRIGKGALIGSGAYLMPGCDIGDGVIVGARAVVLKDAILPAGTVWGGVPAHLLEKHPES